MFSNLLMSVSDVYNRSILNGFYGSIFLFFLFRPLIKPKRQWLRKCSWKQSFKLAEDDGVPMINRRFQTTRISEFSEQITFFLTFDQVCFIFQEWGYSFCFPIVLSYKVIFLVCGKQIEVQKKSTETYSDTLSKRETFLVLLIAIRGRARWFR